MKAIVKEDCNVAPKGYITIALRTGQEISGELADFCVEAGHAEYVEAYKAPSPQITKPLKAPKKRG